jgi:hypothetical protein
MTLLILDPVGALNHGGELLSMAMAAPAFGPGYTIQAWRSMDKAWRSGKGSCHEGALRLRRLRLHPARRSSSFAQ